MEGCLSSPSYQTQSGETRHSNYTNIIYAQFLDQCNYLIEDVVLVPEEYQEVQAELPF